MAKKETVSDRVKNSKYEKYKKIVDKAESSAREARQREEYFANEIFDRQDFNGDVPTNYRVKRYFAEKKAGKQEAKAEKYRKKIGEGKSNSYIHDRFFSPTYTYASVEDMIRDRAALAEMKGDKTPFDKEVPVNNKVDNEKPQEITRLLKAVESGNITGFSLEQAKILLAFGGVKLLGGTSIKFNGSASLDNANGAQQNGDGLISGNGSEVLVSDAISQVIYEHTVKANSLSQADELKVLQREAAWLAVSAKECYGQVIDGAYTTLPVAGQENNEQ